MKATVAQIWDKMVERLARGNTPELKYDAKEVRKILKRQREQRGVKVRQSKLP